MSVVGFVAYYAHYIDFASCQVTAAHAPPPVLLQAGYSYGAMVTTKLPPLSETLAPFESPAVHTAAADIRLRAQHLAEQQNKLSAGPASPRSYMGLRVGGDEDVSRKGHNTSRKGHDVPRKSHDVSRPPALDREDGIRRGVKELLARSKRVQRKHRHQPDDEHAEVVIHEEECMVKVDDLQHHRSAYLVVSPPIGFVTNLATMSFSSLFGALLRRSGRGEYGTANHDGSAETGSDGAEQKLVHNPTLAIYGDQDNFITHRKIREWTDRLESYDASRFRAVKVGGAGHFWMEEGTIYQLRDAVGAFGTELLGRKVQSPEPWDGT